MRIHTKKITTIIMTMALALTTQVPVCAATENICDSVFVDKAVIEETNTLNKIIENPFDRVGIDDIDINNMDVFNKDVDITTIDPEYEEDTSKEIKETDEIEEDKAPEETYTIYFDLDNGEDPEAIECVTGAEYKFPAAEGAKTGNKVTFCPDKGFCDVTKEQQEELLYWEDEEGIRYYAGDTFNNLADTNGSITLTGVFDDGFIEDLPVFKLEGWRIIGWADPETGWVAPKMFMPEEDITLNAIWARNTFTIKFDAEEGYVDTRKKTASYGLPVGTLPVAEKDGYIFQGWYTEDGEQVEEDTELKENDTITLFAHWTPTSYESEPVSEEEAEYFTEEE